MTMTNGKPKQSFLRQLDNLVIGVRDHSGKLVKDKSVITENFKIALSQELLENGRLSMSGQMLLRILGAVEYAGKQGRPVMLMGRKQDGGGFMLTVVVPIDTTTKPGPPPTMQGAPNAS